MIKRGSSIAKRVLLVVVLFTAVVTSLALSILLLRNFQTAIDGARERVETMRIASTPALVQSVWAFNFAQMDGILEGLVSSMDITYVELDLGDGTVLQKGTKPKETGDSYAVVEHPIRYEDQRGQKTDLGVLRITIDYQRAYQLLRTDAQFTVVYQALSLVLLSVLIVWLVNRTLTRHVIRISDFTQKLSLQDLSRTLEIQRESRSGDELDLLVSSINTMREKMLQDIQLREQAEKEVLQLNLELEQKVKDRTKELQHSMEQLNKTLNDLRTTQTQLVEHEKLASLGSLVAGIAHEINTPVGVSYTASSHLDETVKLLNNSFLSGSLTKSEFTDAIENLLECNRIIGKNLQRAAELVKSFKMVAVDQSSEEARLFNLKEYIESTIISLRPKLKRTRHKIILNIPEQLELYSYPGAYSQIVTNFILNSTIHGFIHTDEGEICIAVDVASDQLTLHYRDNGVGIEPEIERKIFEPFVTSNRNSGGSGLGTHIIYNLVTQVLKGRIQLESCEAGVHFIIKVPKQLPEEAPGVSPAAAPT